MNSIKKFFSTQTTQKISILAVSGILIILGVFSFYISSQKNTSDKSESSSSSIESSKSEDVQKAESQISQYLKTRIDYETVTKTDKDKETSEIVIVINPQIADKENLTKLGDQLYNELTPKIKTNIYIFKDREQASKKDRENNLKGSEKQQYLASLVGFLKTDKREGVKSLYINLNGDAVNSKNSEIIKY